MKLIKIDLFKSVMFQVCIQLECGQRMYMSYDYYKKYYERKIYARTN